MPTSPRLILRPLPVVAALVIALIDAGPAAAQDAFMTKVTGKELEGILTFMKYDFTREDERVWQVNVNGTDVMLFLLNDNTDAALYYAPADMHVTPDLMNDWNKSNLFTRAYADDSGNPVLASDLDFSGGVTRAMLAAWMAVYSAQLKIFVKFLKEH